MFLTVGPLCIGLISTWLSHVGPGKGILWINFLFLFILDLFCFVCSFICVLFCSVSVVSQLILGSCSLSQSGMPNNAGPFTVNKLHQNLMPLLFIVTLHMPICGIHKLVYAFYTTFHLWICLDKQFWCLERLL